MNVNVSLLVLVIVPSMWLDLNYGIRCQFIKCSGSLSMFKQTLKTYVFKAEYCNISFSAFTVI